MSSNPQPEMSSNPQPQMASNPQHQIASSPQPTKLLPSPVTVTWEPPQPKKKGIVPSGHMQGRPRKDLRERAVAKTKEALEYENRMNPPRTSQWTNATIRHGYKVNSSGTKDKSGQNGTSRPHVNTDAKAANGFKQTIHIDFKGRVDKKPPPGPALQGPFIYDADGAPKTYKRPEAIGPDGWLI